MRCIEIEVKLYTIKQGKWLTLTWDVLKWNDTDGKTAIKSD